MVADERASQARAAVWADAPKISQTLAQAFLDDPLISFLLPDEQRRLKGSPGLFRILLKLALPYGACDVTSGYEAAALWRPPGHWHVPFYQYIAHSLELFGIFGPPGAFRALFSMDEMERHHPKEPHFYLQTIGTLPAKQGKGFAGILLRRQLAIVDAQGLPAYLESSKETNIPVYRHYGFEVTGEIKMPGGPTLYPMWRNARRK